MPRGSPERNPTAGGAGQDPSGTKPRDISYGRSANHHDLANLIWQIADLLRSPYRPPQYERVMLPMTVLRRFDCVLAPSKAKVLAEYERRKGAGLTTRRLTDS